VVVLTAIYLAVRPHERRVKVHCIILVFFAALGRAIIALAKITV